MLKLKTPNEKLLSTYIEFIEEMRSEGEKIWDGFLPKEGESEKDFVLNLIQAAFKPRPSFRRKGVAKEMLKQLLQTQKAQEIGSLLLTCSPDNIASNKTIIANNGTLVRTAFVQKWERETNYYLIDLNREFNLD